jgi:hypothetical protein
MKEPTFLTSELVLGRLKLPSDLAQMAAHWNELFRHHRQMTRQTEGEQRQLHVIYADIAANRAYRIEAIMREREGLSDTYLPGRLMTAKRRRDEQNVWSDAA